MFDLFKKKKDKPIVEADKKDEPIVSGMKIPTPNEIFTRTTLEEHFACWFNEQVKAKVAHGLKTLDCVEHELTFKDIPSEFLDISKEGKYPTYSYTKQFRPELVEMLKDSNFKPIVYSTDDSSPTISVKWNSNNHKETNSKHTKIVDAATLKEYELDDDKGFSEDITAILASENKDKLFKTDDYNREILIKLNPFKPKYIEHCTNCFMDNKGIDHISEYIKLYPRYEQIMRDNGWFVVRYNNNHRRATGTWYDDAAIIIKDGNQDEI